MAVVAFRSPTSGTDPAPSRWPSRREASNPSYRARARKLTLEQESAIRALAGTKSLRALAADFGVSHETIRAVTRRGLPCEFPIARNDENEMRETTSACRKKWFR